MPFQGDKESRTEVPTVNSAKASTTSGALIDLSNTLSTTEDSMIYCINDDDHHEFTQNELAERMAHSSLYLNYLLSNGACQKVDAVKPYVYEHEEIEIDNYVRLPINFETVSTTLDSNSSFNNKQLITEEQFNQAFIMNVCFICILVNSPFKF